MSNYVKSTNFTAKDSLPTGDANKVIRGSEFDTEFNAIQVASATKANLGSPTFTGTATFADVTVTGTVTAGTIDLNGGALDNVVIGGTTPAAGTFTAVAGTTGTFSGAVTGSNLNIANWNTAYGWGDHASAGYLTSVAFSDMDAAAVVLSSETFVSNDTTLPTTATMTARILAASLGPTASLDDLSDVNLTPAPTDGQTLVFDNSTSKFIAGTSGAGLDGGFANSTYLTAQNFNGGGA
tara:strand:- start:1488 stop:2201 length:714 start_codon:yes stop_codon:yes gene_type:complete